MQKKLSLVIIGLFLLVDITAFAQQNSIPNRLSKKEKRQGWILLFNGYDFTHWKGFNNSQVPSCWSISNGILLCKSDGGEETNGDIISTQSFANFELIIEWSISKGGNSGIFYHIVENPKYHYAYETAPEYQLIDDIGWPGALENWQQCGADYAMHPANENKKLKPAGEWNTTRIVYNNNHVEHWLNGAKIVEFEAYSHEWEILKNSGKWKNYPDYAISKTGKIGLQNHGSGVQFRNIKIKELK